jgi:hypothetical protein
MLNDLHQEALFDNCFMGLFNPSDLVVVYETVRGRSRPDMGR